MTIATIDNNGVVVETINDYGQHYLELVKQLKQIGDSND